MKNEAIELANYAGAGIIAIVALILMVVLYILISEWCGARIDHLWLTMRIWKKNVKLEDRNKVLQKACAKAIEQRQEEHIQKCRYHKALEEIRDMSDGIPPDAEYNDIATEALGGLK